MGEGYSCGCVSKVPGYVANTAGIPAQHVRSLSAFRLGAHNFEVTTGPGAPENNRCVSYVVRELKMNFMCCLSVVVRRCPVKCMLRCLKQVGGWSHISTAAPPTDAMGQFTAQNPRRVASFINACEQRAQYDPPDEVVFGDPQEQAVERIIDHVWPHLPVVGSSCMYSGRPLDHSGRPPKLVGVGANTGLCAQIRCWCVCLKSHWRTLVMSSCLLQMEAKPDIYSVIVL